MTGVSKHFAIAVAGAAFFISAALLSGAAPAARPLQRTIIRARPQSQPAASAPASKPANVEAQAAAAAAAAAALRGKLDASFAVLTIPPFVIAGNMSADDLRAYADGSIIRPANAMYASYFTIHPDKVITVLLLKDDQSYRSWAKRLFGDTEVTHYGYYRYAQRTLVMNISTGSGTLVHELTHCASGLRLARCAAVVQRRAGQPT